MKIKIKLRDMTDRQAMLWYRQNCPHDCRGCLLAVVSCNDYLPSFWAYHKDMFSDKFLDKEVEIELKELTQEEHDYLAAVIKPFRERIYAFHKIRGLGMPYEFICIDYKRQDGSDEFARLYCFKTDTEYKGMKLNKDYTLEELGL